MKDTLPDKLFKVDPKIVITSLLPFQIFFIAAVLIFLNGIAQIPKPVTGSEFWLWTMGVLGVGLLLDLWTIIFNRIEFKGPIITSYFNAADRANILDFVSAKQKKTIYTNYLGFEYKEPKGIYVRYLLPYGYYSPKTLQAIMQEILRINPNIKLEDDLAKQIANATYKNKVLG
jgi:hypothetical protein